jgi:hypothetical protein
MESIEKTLHLIAQDQNLMISLGAALAVGIVLMVAVHIIIKKIQKAEEQGATTDYLVRENIFFKIGITALTIFVIYFLLAQKGLM